jgi:hypothetical protein
MGGLRVFSAHEPPPENRPDESRGGRGRTPLPGERYRHPSLNRLFSCSFLLFFGGFASAWVKKKRFRGEYPCVCPARVQEPDDASAGGAFPEAVHARKSWEEPGIGGILRGQAIRPSRRRRRSGVDRLRPARGGPNMIWAHEPRLVFGGWLEARLSGQRATLDRASQARRGRSAESAVCNPPGRVVRTRRSGRPGVEPARGRHSRSRWSWLRTRCGRPYPPR